MQRFPLVTLVLLVHLTARAQSAPITIAAMWKLDRTFADAAHGVTFLYPGTWTITKQPASYHGPALLQSPQVTSAVAITFSEGGFPRTRVRGPYTRTTLEAVDVVYAAPSVADAPACEELATDVSGSGNEMSKTSHMLNGIRYSVRTTGDGGMNQFISGQLYSAFARGTCYLFETDSAGLEDGVDKSVRTLNKHDLQGIDEHLLAIMRTVHIEQPR